VIGLDTNVLVRFLANDDPTQSGIAAAVIEGATERGVALFVSDVVLVETAWVLSRAYGVTRAALADIVQRLADARHVTMRDADTVRRAVAAFAGGKAEFADYFIGELAREAGCQYVVTFDRALWREPAFTRAKA
jgi:predicted nucleic-acid-binding protein